MADKKFQVNTWVYFKGPDNQYYQGLIKDYDYGDHLYKIEYFHDNGDNGFVKNYYVFEREILDFKFKSGDEIQFRSDVAWRRGKIISSYADKNGRIFYDINPWDEMIKAYTSLRGYKEIPEMNVRTYTDYNKLLWECKDSVPVQPKFKVGDKIIFNEKNIYGTISKVWNDTVFVFWDYDVIEKDTGEIWHVFERDITGVWDECRIATDIPYSKSIFADQESYNIFKGLPWTYQRDIFNNLFKSDSVLLGIDTDSIKVKKEDKKMKDRPRDHKFVRTNTKERKIKEVIFNGPATIIKWEPTMHDYANGRNKGDKTVSVCGVTDPYDKEKGFLLAVIKEFVDNQSYDNILRMMDSFNDEEHK